MWWDEFETCPTNAFATIDKYAGRQSHTNNAKVCLLNNNIQADFPSDYED